jgi:tetratricopeptide (TPR) repeat protein
MQSGVETHRLRQEIERALRRAFDPADVLPRLARLARLAPPGSDDCVFAHRQLAELLVERHPWRAAIHARKALSYRPGDDRAWAVMAFCHTLLGNFRSAVAAYRRAVTCAPGNPWYAHNLGHLLDVAIGSPKRALPWLKSAYGAKPENSEIVASYAHALGRAGLETEARDVLERALSRFESRELEALLHWLDQGAPSHPDLSALSQKTPKKRARVPRDRRLARVLERGLSHLPLDEKQRQRALALARDALIDQPSQPRVRVTERPREDVVGLAAAVAYAIVYVDHVPLSQAEVAAPFRVGVARLRGRFAELRAKLDIIPGDARYATTLL